MELGIWSLELGTSNLELGNNVPVSKIVRAKTATEIEPYLLQQSMCIDMYVAWNLESEAWNLELGTWNLELETAIY